MTYAGGGGSVKSFTQQNIRKYYSKSFCRTQTQYSSKNDSCFLPKKSKSFGFVVLFEVVSVCVEEHLSSLLKWNLKLIYIFSKWLSDVSSCVFLYTKLLSKCDFFSILRKTWSFRRTARGCRGGRKWWGGNKKTEMSNRRRWENRSCISRLWLRAMWGHWTNNHTPRNQGSIPSVWGSCIH